MTRPRRAPAASNQPGGRTVKRWQLPLTIAVVLAVANSGRTVAADEPPMTQMPVTVAEGSDGAVVDGTFAPAPVGMLPAADDLPRGGPIRRRLRAHLQRRGLGCWATHESMGCGSCKADRT